MKSLSIVGEQQTSISVDGTTIPITRLNNAATTAPFTHTLSVLNNFLQTYGALHRGAGPHASTTYEYVQQAIKTIEKFIHLPETHSLVFTQNTSSAINMLARMLRYTKDDVILTSDIEHTSNNLPWRYNTDARIIEIKTFTDGSIDYIDLEAKARTYSKDLKLITITGASNQTGYIPDIKKIARIAHLYDAQLFIDAAQLAPHREIDMTRDTIDMLAFSAHKVYAPFGLGVLAIPKIILNNIPVDPGGGSIDMISDINTVWAPPLERHQTGTWNVCGIIALATSCEILMQEGWKSIMSHEQTLLCYALEKMQQIPNITLYIPVEKYIIEDRIATVPFNISGIHHAKLATILEHEYSIETRAGTICNHRLVRRWFNIDNETQNDIEQKIQQGNRLASYGIVRASIGIYNTIEDIDRLVDALQKISEHGARLTYVEVPNEETFCIEKQTNNQNNTNVAHSDLNYDRYETKQYNDDITCVIPGWEDMHKKIESLILSYKNDDAIKLLELGIGTGLTTKKILDIKPHIHVDAIDFSHTMIQGAQKLLEPYNVNFIEGDYAKITFDKDYDIVCSVIGIHHQTQEGKKELFNKIYTSLKSGGIFVFGDLVTYKNKHVAALNNAKHFHHLVNNTTNDTTLTEWAFHHQYLNELAPLEDQLEWLKEAGFRIVDVIYRHFNTVLIVAKK